VNDLTKEFVTDCQKWAHDSTQALDAVMAKYRERLVEIDDDTLIAHALLTVETQRNFAVVLRERLVEMQGVNGS
jgi:hypothetical protein